MIYFNQREGCPLIELTIETHKAQDFNRGQSAKVFSNVVKEDKAVCVIRNSAPYVAILKYDSYTALLEKARKYDEHMKGTKKK